MGTKKSKNSNKSKGCNNPFVSKKDRKILFNLMNNTDWCDEDSVWDCAIELELWSNRLKFEILRRSDMLGDDVL